MKLFLIWPAWGPEMKILINTLTGAGHTITYWVGEWGAQQYTPEGTIFHDHYEAWKGQPSHDINPYDFPPPSAALIKSLRDVESVTLTMMDKGFDGICVDERRSIYYDMMRYWHGVLERDTPEAIVFCAVPHTVYNYVLYHLAKRKGIPTLMFEQTWVEDRILRYWDYREGNRELQIALKKNAHLPVKSIKLPEDLQKYLERQRTGDPTPWYMTGQHKLNSFWRKFRVRTRAAIGGVMRRTIILDAWGFARKHFGPNLVREYSRITQQPVWDTPYVYVPLAFQPERTSSPQAGIFVDQLLMVETVASALPEGWRLMVKEHPSQWLLRGGINYTCVRYPGYYEHLAKIPKVTVVPTTTDTYQLIEGCQAVALATGTAGWEGLIRGKPVLNFGYSWYRDAAGVLRVNSPESCREALLRVKGGYTADPDDALRFLKSLDEVSYREYVELPWHIQGVRISDEIMERFSKIIVEELKHLPA